MKKLLVLFILIVSCTFAFAAGSQEQDVEQGGTILLWHAWGGAEGDALTVILDQFHAENPGIKVETLAVAWDELRGKYETASASGGGPDFLIGAVDWVGGLADAGLIKPVDTWAGDLAEYLPSAVDALRFEGDLYGIPESIEAVAMYYNKTMVSSPAATLDELLIEAGNGKVAAINAGFYHAFWGIQAFGGRLFNDNAEVVLDQGGFAEWTEWLAMAKDKPGMEIVNDYGKLNAMFKEGLAAYYPDGPWALGDLIATLGEENMGIAPLPSGPAGKSGPFLGVKNFMFNSASEDSQTELAMKFAKYLTNAMNGKYLMDNAGHIPANKNVDTSANEFVSGFMAQAETAVGFPNIPEMGTVWGPGDNAYSQVMDGGIPGIDVAKEASDLINEANGK